MQELFCLHSFWPTKKIYVYFSLVIDTSCWSGLTETFKNIWKSDSGGKERGAGETITQEYIKFVVNLHENGLVGGDCWLNCTPWHQCKDQFALDHTEKLEQSYYTHFPPYMPKLKHSRDVIKQYWLK